MKISSINSPYHFKGATININAFSDVHGHIEKTECAYQAMRKNGAFTDKKRGGANFIINAGDWYIPKNNIGFKDKENKSFTNYQLLMYNKFIETAKKDYPNIKTVFVPASHEFDGGEELFNKLLKKTDSRFISANLDFSISPTVARDDSSDKLTTSTIDFVSDDKNPKISYPVLNVGVSPLNMKTYSGYSSGIYSPPKQITNEKHYLFTMQAVQSIVNKFKSIYPNGIVIITCHTRTDFAKNLAKEVDADIIFNSHEHKAESEQIENTQIVNLSKDFDRISNVQLQIDDNGKLSDIKIRNLYPQQGNPQEESPIGKYFNKLFKKDLEKTHTLICLNKSVQNLSTEGNEPDNNNLANFVTDIVLHQIQDFDKNVDIFALNSSSIKGGFSLEEGKNTSNVDILNCLTGISAPQGEIYTTKVTGIELVEFILEDYLNNMADKENNPIMQYAGIKINKSALMRDYHIGKNLEDLCKYILLKKTEQPIEPDKTYKIANVLKHFQKSDSDNSSITLMNSHKTNHKIHDLFQDYFANHEPVIFTTENRVY